MFKFLKKKDPIAEFWGWFEKNRAFYEDLEDEKLGEHLDPIYQRVAAISPELAVEISRRMENGVRELVISANGDINLFPKVEEIVAAAPEFDRWMITAFRPRMLMESVLEADDLKLDMSKMSLAKERGQACSNAVFFGTPQLSRYGPYAFLLLG